MPIVTLLPASNFADVTPEQLDILRRDGVLPVVVNDVYYKQHTDSAGMYKPRPEKVQILYGGSGSGKSDFKATELLIKSMVQPYCRVVFVRKHKEQIRDSQFQLFKDIISRYRLNRYFQVKESEMDIVCLTSGNMLLSCGLDDVEKLRSIAEPTDIWLEEPLDRKGSIKYSDFTELLRRLRSPRATNHLHLTFNPVSRASWLYLRLFKQDNYNSFKLKTTYKDNVFSPKDEADKYEILRLEDYEEYRIFGLGEWGDPDSDLSVYKNDAISDFFTNSFIQPTGNKYLTVDPALEGADTMVCVVWDGWIVVDIQEYEQTSGPEVLQIIERLARSHGVPGRNIAFDATGLGGFIKGFFANSKPVLPGSSPIPQDEGKGDIQKRLLRKNTYANLRAQMFFHFAAVLDENRAYCSVKNVYLQQRITEELQAIKKVEDPDGTRPLQIVKKALIKEAIGRSPGLADAISMRSVFDLPAAKPQKQQRKIANL